MLGYHIGESKRNKFLDMLVQIHCGVLFLVYLVL